MEENNIHHREEKPSESGEEDDEEAEESDQRESNPTRTHSTNMTVTPPPPLSVLYKNDINHSQTYNGIKAEMNSEAKSSSSGQLVAASEKWTTS